MNESNSSPSREHLAERLLAPLWRALDRDYKRQYARNIWEQFEGQVRSAAYTSRLQRFLQHLTGRLPIVLARAEDVASVASIIGGGHDRAVLKLLREEAAYLVLLVRVANEERKQVGV
jgi:hypothetical protein